MDWANHNPTSYDTPASTSFRNQPKIRYRDPRDAQRSAAYPAGDTEPSGYLGTVNSRREDRLLQTLSHRTSTRNYQRGVHAGSRANPNSYLWPEEFQPHMGLSRQVTGMRARPLLEFAQTRHPLTNDGKLGPQATPSVGGYVQYANAAYRIG